MKLLYRLLLLTAVSLSAACSSKDDDPQPTAPDPAVEATLVRSFTYPANSDYNNGHVYTQKSLTSMATLDATELTLGFGAPEGKDDVSFTIPKTALAAGWQGTYELRSTAAPQGPVKLWYFYTVSTTPSGTQGRIFSYPTQGQLRITSYDAQRQLLSGSYQLRVDDVADPTSGSLGGNGRRCNIEISGTFVNVKVKN